MGHAGLSMLSMRRRTLCRIGMASQLSTYVARIDVRVHWIPQVCPHRTPLR